MFVLTFVQDMADESQRVAELLDHVQKGDERRFKDFCSALKENSQPLIVDMLSGNQTDGGDRTDAVPHDAEDMPLSRQNSCKLTACWNSLIDRMTGPALMAQLESLGVFSDLQMKKLKASNSLVPNEKQICCICHCSVSLLVHLVVSFMSLFESLNLQRFTSTKKVLFLLCFVGWYVCM